MAYEVLGKGKRKTVEEPRVSIGIGGIIYLNAYSMKTYFRDIHDVLLLYDKQKKSLAIRPLKTSQKESFTLNFSSKQRESTGMFTARSPLRHLKLGGTAKKNLPAVWNEKEGLLEVKI